MRTIYQVEVKMSQNISSGQAWAKSSLDYSSCLYPKLISGSSFSKVATNEESSRGTGYTVSYDKTAVTIMVA